MPKSNTNGSSRSVATTQAAEKEKPDEKIEKKEIDDVNLTTPTKTKKQLVKYPELRVSLRYVGEDGGLSEEEAKGLLGWWGEQAAIGAVIAKNPKTKVDEIHFGENYLFIDMNDEKVRCLANKHNRPHDGETSHKYAQDVLSMNWAGPLMLPEILTEVYGGKEPYTMSDGTVIKPGETIKVVNGTVNGETIIIGRYGNIISGQHRLIGFVWACQMWRKDPSRYPKWKSQPVLECIVVTGASEDPRIIRTIDNVKPRQLSDVFYTSPIFADMKSVDKKECSVMAQKAINFLWQRTIPDVVDVYQTHSESINFVERHGGNKGRLMQAIRYIFALNNEHVLSSLKLSPGQCAGLMYLMAASATDGEKYRSGNPPGEKLCDWSREDTAEQFWKDLVGTIADDAEDPKALEAALRAIVDVSGEEAARWAEKLVVLSRAWEQTVAGENVFTHDEDVLGKISLKTDDYGETSKGEPKLAAASNFGGIDLGSKKPEEEPDPEEIEKGKSAERQEREKLIKEAAERHKAKVEAKAKGKEPEPASATLKGQQQTRRKVEQEQTARAADADFLKTWDEWAAEDKLASSDSDVYLEQHANWVAAGRGNIVEFLAELVRNGDASPDAVEASDDEEPEEDQEGDEEEEAVDPEPEPVKPKAKVKIKSRRV